LYTIKTTKFTGMPQIKLWKFLEKLVWVTQMIITITSFLFF